MAFQSQITQFVGNNAEVLAIKSDPTLLKEGGKYPLEVKVSERAVKAYFNGRLHMSAKKKWGHWGQLGIGPLPDFEEIRICGLMNPSWIQGLVDASELFLLDGSIPDAERTILAAKKSMVDSQEIEKINIVLVKAERGPNWVKTHECQTEHYKIVSDIDREICITAGKELEAAFARYEKEFGQLKRKEEKKARVFLFKGKAGHTSYVEDLFDRSMEGSAGLYSYHLKQLLIWNLSDRREMFQAIRHEAVHQYLDELGADPPPWFNEGLAEYHSILVSEGRGKKPKNGLIKGEYARLLQRTLSQLVPLKVFFYLEYDRFYQFKELLYPQSWAFIHFLKHSSKENRELYDNMLETIKTGIGKMKSVDKVFGSVDLDALNDDFQAYVQNMK